MKRSFLILLVPLLVLLAQCQQDTRSILTTVEGVVREYGTRKPLSNVLVYVRKGVDGSGWTVNWTTQDTIRTDAQGGYRIVFRHEPAGLYEVALVRPPLYAGTYLGRGLALGRTTTQDFLLNPPAWLKIRVQNINPFNARDTIWFWGTDMGGSLYMGTNIDKIYEPSPEGMGNRFNHLIYYSSKNGISSKKHDSFYCKAHDTTFIHIKY